MCLVLPHFPIYQNLFNPLTPGAFCQKCVLWTFWRFWGWILAKLALIWSKRHLQHDSLPFLPLTLCFTTFWIEHAQKSEFWEILLWVFTQLFEHFCVYLRLQWADHSDLGIIKKIFSSFRRWVKMMPILAKVMTSEVEERPRLVTAGYGWHRSQWVKNKNKKLTISTVYSE